MPRPVRIEYPNAFYHVMNRGRARNDIFLRENHYLTFLKIIEESFQRFDFCIHSYCLMPNHYHLLIQTYKANLGRVMRHINGIYTQRFNKIEKIDGPLFRGRYKSILVDEDSYLLQLSRYIHKNPIEVKSKKLVENLRDYQWSSYPSYLNLRKTPNWLNKERTLSFFEGNKDVIRKYELFVNSGEDEESSEFSKQFSAKNQKVILGNHTFKNEICNMLSGDIIRRDKIRREINDSITDDDIIEAVSIVFAVSKGSILNRQISRKFNNFPRRISMYLIQKIKDRTLNQISEMFGLTKSTSVNYYLATVKKELDNDDYKLKLQEITDILNLEQLS